jgi:hypothetical protein
MIGISSLGGGVLYCVMIAAMIGYFSQSKVVDFELV